jgi:hypothetical protein
LELVGGGLSPNGCRLLAWVRYGVEFPPAAAVALVFVRILALFPFSFLSSATPCSLYLEFRLHPSVCINARGLRETSSRLSLHNNARCVNLLSRLSLHNNARCVNLLSRLSLHNNARCVNLLSRLSLHNNARCVNLLSRLSLHNNARCVKLRHDLVCLCLLSYTLM